MLKVFLVEDEVIVREGIKNNMNWEENGFIFCGEASDGELAYPQIQKLCPDIIITDIKMPFMDGLELSRLVKKEMPLVKIIILSGYDDFAYAKEAISIGITDYLLKPIAGAELLKAVRAVGDTILSEQEERKKLEQIKQDVVMKEDLERRDFFSHIINLDMPVSKLLEKGKRLQIDLSAPVYNVVLFKIWKQNGASDEIEEYSAEVIEIEQKIRNLINGKDNIISFIQVIDGSIYLIKGNDKNEVENIIKSYLDQFSSIISGYDNIHYFGGVGQRVERLREITLSFNKANKAFAYRYIFEPDQIIRHDTIRDYRMNNDPEISLKSIDMGKLNKKLIEGFLRKGLKNEVSYFIDDYTHSLGAENIDSYLFRQYIAMDIYFSTAAFVEQLGYSADVIMDVCGDISQFTAGLSSVIETKEYLAKLLSEAIVLRDAVSLKKYNVLLEKAKEYIEIHYVDEDISLNAVAASVNVSPSHFSMIFSQEIGQTFIEYLTRIRMEKAMELLRCTDMKTSQVGYEVGYKDSHYFSYLFKKNLGITPKEYRQSNLKR
jgi:two-component system response regulator YesN